MLKSLFIGKPMETSNITHERLTKKKALAVFSSDALSSVAYATDEITIALASAGTAALAFELHISFAILVLLVILTFSYRQTIQAYPSGGGAFIVAKENLGETPGLIAGSALLIDYVLTVAVSISAGVAQIGSAFPSINNHKISICILFILIIALANLRGVRESGTLFSLPTYIFIFSLFLMIIIGLIKFIVSGSHIISPHINTPSASFEPITIFLMLRAFASGCAALTGVEAISNGVPAFIKPEAKNAKITLLWMSITLFTLFLGTALLAKFYGAVGSEQQTVISQIGTQVFGRDGFSGILYYIMQFSTMFILVLAANTSYADFPRLASLLAKDGYLPRIMAALGDRLVFSNGILLLTALSCLLIIIFRGDTHLLIPLYAVGVFISFTLSQSGMIKHWLKNKEPGYTRSMAINGLGAVVTFIVTIIVAYEKFKHGAWIVIVLIPIIVQIFKKINKHYITIADELRFNDKPNMHKLHPRIIIPVAGLSKVVVNTVQYAKSLSDNITVVHISLDNERAQRLKEKWESWNMDIPFEILDSPYRSITQPLLDYINIIYKKTGKDEILTILIPEFVEKKWWHNLLHNQTGFLLRNWLLMRKDIVVASVPYHLRK